VVQYCPTYIHMSYSYICCHWHFRPVGGIGAHRYIYNSQNRKRNWRDLGLTQQRAVVLCWISTRIGRPVSTSHSFIIRRDPATPLISSLRRYSESPKRLDWSEITVLGFLIDLTNERTVWSGFSQETQVAEASISFLKSEYSHWTIITRVCVRLCRSQA